MTANNTVIMPEIKHDGLLSISTGASRTEKKWKNKQTTWAALLTQFAETTRTRETITEYDKMPKSQQDGIKDVGGYIGGTLKAGDRKSGVIWRHLLTLDLDFAQAEMWAAFVAINDYAACIYSTHKHRPDTPRFRQVIPLKRPVTPDEYVAIGRMIACQNGMDQYDDTCFEPGRLMYWPSTSKDAEYVFKVQDGEWLDPDEILALYGPENAWKDPGNWPESSRSKNKRQRLAARQGNPLEKKGVVGAFCRTYALAEAVEMFLPGVYEPCDIEGRWTFAGGSTFGGAVEYEGKWLYSHHATDPISGKLCNAWDLVRIHKYSDQDEDSTETLPVTKLPSYKAMRELALGDEAVRLTLGRDTVDAAMEDFDDIEDDKWLTHLKRTATGLVDDCAYNVLLILRHDPMLAGKFRRNEFTQRVTVSADLPWRAVSLSQNWTDEDDAGLRNYCSRVYEITGRGIILDAFSEVLLSTGYHPIKDYLNGLVWDEAKRLDTMLVEYFGAEDNEYTRTVTRKTLVAAVARVMEPGVKFDTMLVLIGPQGIGKSTLWRKLARAYFSDSLTTVQGKEAYEQLIGKWILEFGELAAMKRSDEEWTKHFLSKSVDSFRVAYGRNTTDFPRQCIFVGSANHTHFLKDPTGNRRFWSVDCCITKAVKKVFADMTETVVDQIWAEAAELYRQGEDLHLSDVVEQMAIVVQEEHMEESVDKGRIEKYLDTLLPESWPELNTYQRRQYLDGEFGEAPQGGVLRTRVCIAEILMECLGLEFKSINKQRSWEIRGILMQIKGWGYYPKRLRFGKEYGQQRAFVRYQSDGKFYPV